MDIKSGPPLSASALASATLRAAAAARLLSRRHIAAYALANRNPIHACRHSACHATANAAHTKTMTNRFHSHDVFHESMCICLFKSTGTDQRSSERGSFETRFDVSHTVSSAVIHSFAAAHATNPRRIAKHNRRHAYLMVRTDAARASDVSHTAWGRGASLRSSFRAAASKGDGRFRVAPAPGVSISATACTRSAATPISGCVANPSNRSILLVS